MSLAKRLSLLFIPLLLFAALVPCVTAEKAYADDPVWFEAYPDPAFGGVFWVNGVLYNSGGAHIGMYAKDDVVILDAMNNPGYSFDYWENGETGLCYYTPSVAVDLVDDYTTFVVHFKKATTYPLTVYANPTSNGEVYCNETGGWGTWMYEPNVLEGSAIYIEANAYSGYEFTGWYDGMGNWITDSNPYSFTLPDGGWSLYAQFEIAGYTVHVEPNGGTGYMPDPSIKGGENYTLPECGFTPPYGMEFAGWDVGQPGETITIWGETWIYAQWKSSTVYHLVYIDPNGGGGFMLDPYVEHGTEYTLPANEFYAPEGKEFAGWDVGQPGEKITVNADMSIHAQWKDIAFPESSGSSASSSSASSSDPAASSGSAASSESAASSSSAASTDATSSGSAASSSSASTDSGSSASTSSSSSSSSGTGSSGTGSSGTGSGGQGKDDLPILPIAGGVVVGGGIVGLIAWLVSRRKKEDDDDGNGGPTKGTQVDEAPAAAPIQPIAEPTQSLPHEEEGFED